MFVAKSTYIIPESPSEYIQESLRDCAETVREYEKLKSQLERLRTLRNVNHALTEEIQSKLERQSYYVELSDSILETRLKEERRRLSVEQQPDQIRL